MQAKRSRQFFITFHYYNNIQSQKATRKNLCILDFVDWSEGMCTFCRTNCDEMSFSLNFYSIHALIVNAFCADEHRVGDGYGIIFRVESDDQNDLEQYICGECSIQNEDEAIGIEIVVIVRHL